MESAARHYADVETELGLGEYTEDEAARGEEALSVLSERFPGVRERSHEKVENGAHLPNLSRSANRKLEQPEGESESNSEEQHPPADHPVRQRHVGAARRASRGRSRYRQAFEQTGIPGGAESVSQLTLRTLGGLAGLSFLYLILSPRGVRAVQLGSNGVTDSLRALISPAVDPLRAVTHTPAQAGALAGTEAGFAAGAQAGSTPTAQSVAQASAAAKSFNQAFNPAFKSAFKTGASTARQP